MLLTTQRDIDEAVEKYGMPLLLQARTAATANKDAANNDGETTTTTMMGQQLHNHDDRNQRHC